MGCYGPSIVQRWTVYQVRFIALGSETGGFVLVATYFSLDRQL